ncbi:protein Rf1, mitochondrial [Setaria italica]|uniref:protein Rf1, mitochondrial n=1 Tax=Setaria italica TaxID=4555 RepID=UPI000350DEFB|nr:protein Rf1, mitochondrial [Setaria italica]
MKQSLVASLEHTIGDRSRSRSLGPDDALRLFDELIRQQRSRPGSVIAYNHLLAAAARGSNNGAARAVSLFGRMAGAGAAVPDACTYSILIASCCRAGRVDLAFSPLATALKADLRMTPKSFTPLLRGLCGERRVAVRAEAVDVARRMMPELGCAPNAFSHSAILKGLCDDGRSLEALELLRTLAQNGDETGVVSYTIVIDGLFKKTRGYGTAGQWKRAVTMFKEMVGKGIKPHVSNYNSLIGALCKHRRSSEARKFLDYMLKSGEKPDVNTYGILLHGY